MELSDAALGKIAATVVLGLCGLLGLLLLRSVRRGTIETEEHGTLDREANPAAFWGAASIALLLISALGIIGVWIWTH